MEASMLHGGIVPGGPFHGGPDLQRSMQIHQEGAIPHVLHHPRCRQMPHQAFPCDQMISARDSNKGDRYKNTGSAEDDRSLAEDGIDNPNDANKGNDGAPWHRVKWTDKMVRLLITAASYLGEEAASDCGDRGRRKLAVLQKKGKWRLVSKVLAERGHHVSPQQCEDKFNDLNKRYKKLNDMLGRGTSCQVVENPALLDVIDFLSLKEKDDVRKILSSKHLFYEEMCSYHNGNRLHLPHDAGLQRSLHQALRNRDEHEGNNARESHHEDTLELEHDYHDDYDETYGTCCFPTGARGPTKKMKQGSDHGASLSIPHKCGEGSDSLVHPDMSHGTSDNVRMALLLKRSAESRSVQLQEQKMQIQVEMLELERQKHNWERFCRKKDRGLEKMRMENERMKLENNRLALKLKTKGMRIELD
ncbi:hypothetical protein SAY87_028307 [Trapa incisa]|uniref:Myb/SANT-like DNA-binding domain-containing protein n=1 Tax=Trapa incisa TaxID=236973 RepID=A0AAN7KZK1_9MYRT|nr:hypothetical protein SAY87_028307 [Trapa incisa]